MKLRKRSWILPVCLAATALAQNNIVTGFSSASNPNGVWSYYYDGSLYALSQGSSTQGHTTLPGWWTDEGQPNSIYILQNTTGSTYTVGTASDPTGTLWLAPESGTVSVVYTAPVAGTYAISGDFLGIDTVGNTHPVEILDDGSIVWDDTISANGDDQFNLQETLKAGDTIAFEVTGPGTTNGCSYCFLSTGLDGTVAETPESGSWFLFAIRPGRAHLVPLPIQAAQAHT